MVGDLLRAFANDPEYKPQYVSEQQHILDDQLTAQILKNLGLANDAISKYGANISADTGRANAAVRDYERLMGNIRGRTNDPMDAYRQLLDYNLSKIQPTVLNNVANNRLNYLRRAAAARGVNISPDSSYMRLLANQENAQAYTPLFTAALSSTGSTLPELYRERMGNDEFSLGLTPRYLDLLNTVAARPLLPERARSASLSDLINQAGGTTALNRGNIAAWIKHRSGLEKWADAADALKSGAWEGLSFYQNLMGMPSFGGGSLGGSMGGKKGSPLDSAGAEAARTNQINRGYGTPDFDSSARRLGLEYETPAEWATVG